MSHPGTQESPDPPGPRSPLADPAAGEPRAARPAPTGDRSAGRDFADFYRGHFARLFAYLVYQGAAAHLAADIAQEAMIATYRRWAEVKSPRAYTWTVAYRAFIRQALEDAPEALVDEVPEPASVLPQPEEAEEWLQRQQIIEILRALPPRQRQVLALTIDDWTPAEIAELLDIDAAAVRASLMKARRSAAQHQSPVREEP